jgi:hypothetical protein
MAKHDQRLSEKGDARLSAGQGEDLADRSAHREPGDAERGMRDTDRVISESREITDDERLDMFRAQFFNEVLPDLPPIPGYHICWLTTTNPNDSIPKRLRLGYEPVRPEDVPGWDHATLKTGEYAGLIGVNEMLAFKLPLRLYQRYMEEAHYNAPMREQEKLTAAVDSLREQARSKGADVVEGDGFTELRTNKAPRPDFIKNDAGARVNRN